MCHLFIVEAYKIYIKLHRETLNQNLLEVCLLIITIKDQLTDSGNIIKVSEKNKKEI